MRLAFALTLMAGGAGFGCATIVGVDFAAVRLDSEAGTSPQIADGSAQFEGDAGPATSTCTPESNAVACDQKCGPTSDNCQGTRQCSTNCGVGKTCTNGKCECVSVGAWCNNRCDTTQDNCGHPVNCGSCDAGVTCTDNSCGCVPDPIATTCGTKSCGTAINNCGQIVACGSSGNCTMPGAICNPDGTCCADDGQACNGKCGVTVTNNCGQTVGCPSTCPSGLVCQGGACCKPDPLATTCAGVICGPKTNNCGQTVTCPDTCTAPNVCNGSNAGPNACGCAVTSDDCGSRCNGTGTTNCGTTVNCTRDCDIGCGCNGGYCSPSGCKCNGGTICR